VPLAGIAGPGAARLHYKGANFYRVIRGFICQTGINTPSVFGRPMPRPPGGSSSSTTRCGAPVGHRGRGPLWSPPPTLYRRLDRK